jgi:acetyl-CoA C-acetyltransferase
MHYEAWLQLRNAAGEERQIDSSRGKALIHNLGGYPGEMVSFVSIVGINPG